MTRLPIILLVLLCSGIGLFLFLRSHQTFAPEQAPAQSAEGDEAKPVAQVRIVPVQRKSISEKLTAYGSVVAQPGKTHFVAISFESRVQHILVSPGQLVMQGDTLLEVQASPASLLQLHQAEGTAAEALKELDQAKKRFEMKLATNLELNQAQKAASDAELQLESIRDQGVAADNKIQSDITGIVAKVDVEDGQVASAGSPLLELIATGDIEIKLGVEPEDVAKLQLGQRVVISLVNDPAASEIEGTVRLVTQRVNPADRLVDVFVSVPRGTNLLLAAYVRGEIIVASRETLVVPRDAVLPEDGSHTLYIVQNHLARKKTVEIGLQTDSEVEVVGPELRDGDQVVTVGNRELADEMQVKY
ncbi:MAG TPA: efflux RND transporter periplasmic adaptor subunit [Chthoniobacterales bacterium]